MTMAKWEPRRLDPGWRDAFFVVGAGALWYRTTLEMLVSRPDTAIPFPPGVAAVVAVGTQLMVSAAEAAWYGVVARALGRRPSWRMLAIRLFILSAASAVAAWLATRDLASGSLPASWLLGADARGGAAAGLLARMFVGVGALAGLRLLLTADAVATCAGLGHRWALFTVTVSWLASRLAQALLAGLILGRSFAP